MARAKKPAGPAKSESVVEIADLLQLLSVPEAENCYGCEIELIDGEVPDVIALAKALPDVASPFGALSDAISPAGAPTDKSARPQGKEARPQGKEANAQSAALRGTKAPAPENKASGSAANQYYLQKHIKSLSLQGLPNESEDSLERIAKEIASCTRCPLYKTRNKTVAGMGPNRVKLVLIGEAPGADEDLSGIPFVGKAGKHLDKILAAAKINKEEIYICNILKCRPPNNRDPLLSEMNCCTPFLQRQLRLLKPSIIACLGNIAVKYVIGPGVPGITRIHGQWFDSIFSIPAMAMYHPSYLIRSASRTKGSPNWQMWQDIQALKKRCDSLK